MLKLGAPESGWRDIAPGVRVQFAPIGIKTVRAARVACGLALKENEGDFQEASDALSRELIRRGLVAWEGIGDAEGDPLPVSPESIEMFLDEPITFEAAERLYVQPWLFRDMEGNASAGSSNGILEEGTPANNTVSDPALAAPASDAVPTPKPRKRAAPTASMSRPRKRAKSSSKS